MPTEQLTYAQIAERLNVSTEAARAIVKRNRLPREQLEAELAAEQQRLAGHRADYERERERADHPGQNNRRTQKPPLASPPGPASRPAGDHPDVARHGMGLAAHGWLMNFLESRRLRASEAAPSTRARVKRRRCRAAEPCNNKGNNRDRG